MGNKCLLHARVTQPDLTATPGPGSWISLLHLSLLRPGSLPATGTFMHSSSAIFSLLERKLMRGFGLVGLGHVTGPCYKEGWETDLWFPHWEVRPTKREMSPGKGGLIESQGLYHTYSSFSHSQTRLTDPSISTSP